MPGAPTGGNIGVDQPDSARAEPSIRLVSVDARAESRATPQDFGAGLAQGMDSIAKGLDDAGQQIQEVSNKRDALFAQQIATKAEVDWKQNLSQAEQAFALDPSKGVNYADTFKQQFNDYQEKVMAGNPDITPYAKALVMTHLNNVGASMFGDALHLQAKASTDWSVQSFTNTSDNIMDAANAQGASVTINSDGSLNSTFAVARDKLISLYKTANGQVPTKMVRDRLLQDYIELDKAEIDTSTNQNGAGVTAKLISEGKLGTSLTIPQRQTQILELQRQEQENTTAAIRDYSEMTKGYGLQVQMTGQRDPAMEQKIQDQANKAFGTFGPAYAAAAGRTDQTDEDKFEAQKQLDQIQSQIDNKYPTKEAKNDFLKSLQDPNHTITPQEESDAFYVNFLPHIREGGNPLEALDRVKQFQANFAQQVQDNVKVNQGAAQLKSLSVDDLQDAADTLKENSDSDRVSKILAPIAEARVKAIKQDAFTVAAQDDKGVAGMLDQSRTMLQNASAAHALGTITKPDNSGNELYQQAVARSLTIQSRLNPQGAGMVMSKNDADHFVSQLTNAKDSTELSQTLSGIQQRFGPYFNQALAQMHNNKGNPLPSGIGLVAGNIGEPNAKDIATAISIPDGNSQGKEKENDDNPGYSRMFKEKGSAADEKEIDSQIQGNPILTKYTDANAAVSNSKATLDLVNGTKDAAAKYAKFLYLNPPPGTSYTPKEASDAAVQSTIGKHIDFGDTNGVTYLINRESSKGTYTDADTAKIKGQLNQELLDISSKFHTGEIATGNQIPDYTNQYNTKLSSSEETQFQQWKQRYAPNDSGSDYDLRGAFKTGVTPDGERGHFPDTFKKPNHPTFSDQSQYSTPQMQGGHWGEDNSFTPSEMNLNTYGANGLKGYFSRVEPESKLNLPSDLDIPGNLGKASLYDIQSRAYWVTKSDLSGVSLFVKPVDGQSVSRTGIPVPNSFRSFDDMLNKANTNSKLPFKIATPIRFPTMTP